VDGRFVAGSVVAEANYDVPCTFIADQNGFVVPTTGGDAHWSYVPVAGIVKTAKLLPYPSDASLLAYVKSSLNAGGQFVFDDSI